VRLIRSLPIYPIRSGRAIAKEKQTGRVFPVLRRILEKITGGEAMYKSPTDVGVNPA
jgi:uncharacterized protein (UPF0371 family)